MTLRDRIKNRRDKSFSSELLHTVKNVEASLAPAHSHVASHTIVTRHRHARIHLGLLKSCLLLADNLSCPTSSFAFGDGDNDDRNNHSENRGDPQNRPNYHSASSFRNPGIVGGNNGKKCTILLRIIPRSLAFKGWRCLTARNELFCCRLSYWKIHCGLLHWGLPQFDCSIGVVGVGEICSEKHDGFRTLSMHRSINFVRTL